MDVDRDIAIDEALIALLMAIHEAPVVGTDKVIPMATLTEVANRLLACPALAIAARAQQHIGGQQSQHTDHALPVDEATAHTHATRYKSRSRVPRAKRKRAAYRDDPPTQLRGFTPCKYTSTHPSH